MGVGELCVEDQAEARVPLHVLATQSDIRATPLAKRRSRNDGHQRCVDCLPHVFDQHAAPSLQRILHSGQHIALPEPHYQQLTALALFDPANALQTKG